MAIQKITSGILADGAIVAADIANGSITTAKIADGNVTSAKIDTVANTKITGLVTSGQIANVANTQVTGSIEATQVGTTVSQLFGMRNRIINGAMLIDQRNAGASVALGAGITAYPTDRYRVENNTTGTATGQNVSDAPTGFSNSLKYTVTATDVSLAATENVVVIQPIEGFNTADLVFGTASAKTITISFWVKSSVTGTFGGSILNSSFDRFYPYSYTISVVNTWEYKTVTIPGDTTGTWVGATNGVGLRLMFCLAAGADRIAAAGAWTASLGYGPTGQTNLMATSAATWQVTGVQLEVGSSATPFERRLYNQELANCQRYYYRNKAKEAGNRFGSLFCESTTLSQCIIPFPVSMRTNPTALEQSGTAGDYTVFAGGAVTTCSSVPTIGNATTEACNIIFTVASGLTIGHGGAARALNTNAYLGFSAEL